MKQFHILLIEDNLGDITLIQDYIEEQFASPYIEVARSFKESMSILNDKAASFHIILLDLSLPDKSGAPLINELLAHADITCPVIILSGYADIEFSIKSISLGISDYLLKDELTAGMLYKSITYSIERNDLRQKLQESEKKFTLLFNLSPQPMWVYDVETLKFININEAAFKSYGYTEEEFLQRDITQLHITEERETVRKTIKYLNSKGVSFSGSFRQIKKNGEEIEVELYSTFLTINERRCSTMIAIDVTEKNMAELRLTKAIIETQEEERNVIGGELHDNICQILAGSMLHLSSIKAGINAEKATILSYGLDNIKQASNEIRNLSHRLAPAFFDDMELGESLLQLLSSVNPEGKLNTHITVDKALNKVKLKRDLQINLYRIMQEQLNNIVKYSKASSIDASLTIVSGNLKFEIADNGVGFDMETASKGIGFANMKRRSKLFSGSFNVSSSINNGCKVTITIPKEQLT